MSDILPFARTKKMTDKARIKRLLNIIDSLQDENRGLKYAVYLLEAELKAERDAIAERARRRAMN